MCLDTANVLIEQRKYDDAAWVIDFAVKRFSEELGVEGDMALRELKPVVEACRKVEKRSSAQGSEAVSKLAFG